MKILFALDAPCWPDSVNGAVITVHEYAQELIKLGHSVAVFGRFANAGWHSLRLRGIAKLSRNGLARDARAGYTTYQSWSVCDAASVVCAEFKPDVAVIFAGEMTPLASALARSGPRIWLYHHTKTRFLDSSFRPSDDWGQMACSAFLAESYAALYDLRPAVIRPFVRPEKYKVPKRGESVLFVNPIPDKGVDVALALARHRPDVNFIFLESWSVSNDGFARVRDESRQLNNVIWRRSTGDMRTVFSETRLVLIPSRCEEAWGRLAGEAYCSGIPVLASAIGGLVESVGAGGRLVLPGTPIAEWFRQFSAIWDDQAEYERCVQAAFTISNNADSTPRACAIKLLSLLTCPALKSSP